MTSSWRQLPGALLLVAILSITPLVRFYASNLHEGLSRLELGQYALLWCGAVLAVYGVLFALFRPRGPRFTATFAVLLVVCMNYYDVGAALSEQGASYAAQNLAWLALGLALVAVAARFGAGRNFQFFLWCFALLGLALPLSSVLRFDPPDEGPGLPLDRAYPLADSTQWSGVATFKPNVYWLVVDSYPNRDVLLDFYSFDNTPFLASLEARGFYVANESYANFSTTRLSVPTTLDMDYVIEGSERYSEDRGDVHVRLPGKTNSGMIAAVAGDNRTVAYFRQLGYRYVHYEGNSFHLTRCRGLEDRCIRGGGFSELQLSLLSLLPIRPVLSLVDGKDPGPTLHRSPSESGTGIPELGTALRELDVAPPYFLYAHFASPHPPFYTDAQCRRSPSNYPLNPHQFTEQLQCVNLHLDALLDQLQESDPNALIVLSSDHGPRLSVRSELPTSALKRSQILESLGVLDAFKLPARCRQGLHPRISPVNSMRIVFACIGGHPPQLIRDEHFVARPSADRGVIRRVEVY